MRWSSGLLASEIASVVNNGNCSGCGMCAGLFPGIEMSLSAEGYMRPIASELRSVDDSAAEVRTFNRVCPGRQVVAPASEEHTQHHEIFGRYVGVWEGWAVDKAFRHAGSSGGVLTAISAYISEKTQLPGRMVAMDEANPTRSVPVRIMSKSEALKAAGSRYAPVSVAAELVNDVASVTGKPCEIAAIRASQTGSTDAPLALSFFCAGTPSQNATDQLIRQLGHTPEDAPTTKYRGHGWPGDFVVRSNDRTDASMSYEESWGRVLGKQLQERCKICVDGTGESADIAVGDFWASDDAGYPLFDDNDGRSVVIARTNRGAEVIKKCIEAGVLEVRPIALDEVAKIQPLQVKRRRSLPGRLAGRLLLGQPVPRYPGYKLTQTFFDNLSLNLRALAGTVRRRLLVSGKGR